MQDALSTPPQVDPGGAVQLSGLITRIRSEAPSIVNCGVALISAALLVFSFPDFNLWLLAWVSLVPLFLIVARNAQPWRSFYLGWLFGSVFFYGSCYWLTYSMIHFGGIESWLAFLLLIPGAVLLGIFPAVFTLGLALVIRKWGAIALFLSPLFWSALEWSRLETTGQLWNALGYSQAYHPSLIQLAGCGGVYLVGFLIVLVNAAIAFGLLNRTVRALAIATAALLLVTLVILISNGTSTLRQRQVNAEVDAVVVAIQPNV